MSEERELLEGMKSDSRLAHDECSSIEWALAEIDRLEARIAELEARLEASNEDRDDSKSQAADLRLELFRLHAELKAANKHCEIRDGAISELGAELAAERAKGAADTRRLDVVLKYLDDGPETTNLCPGGWNRAAIDSRMKATGGGE